jgi:Regulator of chromosome condensation (RCC1) repeat
MFALLYDSVITCAYWKAFAWNRSRLLLRLVNFYVDAVSMVTALSHVKATQVQCGGFHTAVLDSDGAVYTFGKEVQLQVQHIALCCYCVQQHCSQ